MSTKTKVVFCKSRKCETDQLDFIQIQKDLNNRKLEFIEVVDLCLNLEEINKLQNNIVLACCSSATFKNKIDENNRNVVFAMLRESCIWRYQDKEIMHNEALLEIKLALNRLRFKNRSVAPPLKSFNKKMDTYIKKIHEIGPNPFKV
jgi:heterodisulfide reductase subunit A-like polyferredoxin